MANITVPLTDIANRTVAVDPVTPFPATQLLD